jgi:hypothetical protein
VLEIKIPSVELYDEVKEEFIVSKEQILKLEHSLVSLSRWESKWCKPFLSKENRTFEESVEYVRCMTTTPNVDPDTYKYITPDIINKIKDYIDAPMTATTFPLDGKTPNHDTITAEIIYYWMIALNIPFECEKWHLNRLLTLINVCNVKNQPVKKMSKKEIMSRNAAINAKRRQQMNTNG